ncbi:hypothetical protein EIP91_007178 [Steccherinum ochraceum]|uniref:Uncharacterized protein n=1 Tax=Steccherinum ochraceum TaxID=92696 RepID=A0A4R0S0V4_9APHY|nr:hypothetical protein EIP91_007178 [Steccherinum ochraceum]
MNASSLPDPLTPLAWLSPELAGQVANTRYVLAAITGAWVWDVLMSIPDLIRIYSVSTFKVPDISDLLGRLASGSFIFATLMLTVASVDDCNALAKAVGWTLAITLPLHTLPFFFCSRAVFHNSRPIIGFFFLLWLISVGGSIASPFFIHAHHIGDTKQCLIDIEMPFSAGVVSAAFNNGVTFFSISFHLMLYTTAETWSGRFNALLHSRGAGEVSKLLMQSGQQFIIPIVVISIATAIVNVIPAIPANFRLLLVVVNVAVQSSMSARIHKHIKTGLVDSHPTTVHTNAVDRTIEFRRAEESRLSRQSRMSKPPAVYGQRSTMRSDTIELSPTVILASIGSSERYDEKRELDSITEEEKYASTLVPGSHRSSDEHV